MQNNETATATNPSSTAPAASSEPSKNDDIFAGGLFDDLDDAESPKLKSDIKENLPVVKKPGAWDSDVTHGRI